MMAAFFDPYLLLSVLIGILSTRLSAWRTLALSFLLVAGCVFATVVAYVDWQNGGAKAVLNGATYYFFPYFFLFVPLFLGGRYLTKAASWLTGGRFLRGLEPTETRPKARATDTGPAVVHAGHAASRRF
jgi:hypothetical protein